jgi:copper chaperone CopZ
MSAFLVAALLFAQEDAYTVTLAFEKMHCGECKAEVEAIVGKTPGCVKAAVEGDSLRAVFEEKAAIPAFNRLPADLRLKSIAIDLRGTVSFTGDKATLVAKGSGASLALANPASPKEDRLAALRKAMGGKNRFQVTGQLAGGKTIVLGSFSATDWKDSK